MPDVTTSDVWIAPEKAYALFGSLTNNTITYESGASIWVPARPDEHMLRGCSYTATGTQRQLQQLAAKLISQALGSECFVPDSDLKQWCYLNEQDEQFGPFSGRQLSKFNASGAWQQDFLICHEPSAVWLPVWLVLQLVGLPAAAAKPAAAAPAPTPAHAHAPALAPKPRRKKSNAKAQAATNSYSTGAAGAAVGPENGSTVDEQLSDAAMSEDEQSAAAAVARPAAAAQPAPAAPAAKSKNKKKKKKPAAAGTSSYSADPAGDENNTSALEEQIGDAEMLEYEQGAAALLAQVALLRQDSGYIEELSRAVDMEIDESWDWQQQPPPPPQPQQQQAGDLPELPATQLSALPGGLVSSNASAATQQQQQQLVVVLDTNVLLDIQGLALLKQLQRLQECSKAWLQLLVLLPWTVLVELDRLKSRQGGRDSLLVAGQARAAVRHLQAAMAQGSSCSHMYKPQSMLEFRNAAREHSLGGDSDKDLVADDRILQCAMHAQQQQQQQQQAHGGGVAGLVLLTNDLVLQLKAKANSVPAAGLRDLPAIATAQGQQQQVLLVKLMQAAGLSTSYSITALAQHAAAAAISVTAAAAAAVQPAASSLTAGQAVSPHPYATDTKHQQVEPQQPQESRSKAEIAAAAVGLITRLRLALTEKVERILRLEFEEVWLDVVCAKPPWRDEDFLYVLHKHWRSVLQGHLGSSAGLSRELEGAAKRLMGMQKQLLQQSSSTSSKGQHSSHAQLRMQRIEADVAVLVVQLLQAFDADATAQEVAAAAGLATADTALVLPATAAAGVTSEQEGLSRQVLGCSSSGQVDRQREGSRAAAAAPQVEASRPGTSCSTAADARDSVDSSTAAAAAAGQDRRVRPAVRHHQGQQQQLAGPQHVNSSSPAQQAVQCAAAQGNKKQCLAASEVLQQQQQQQQQDLQQLQQQQHQQTLVLQQQQHQQRQSPQGDNQPDSTALLIAAAAAAVPAPALQGPCMRLQQLLQYALALLHAVMQPLQAAVTQGVPAAHAAAAALAQQLQQVVLQLERLVQQLQQQLLSMLQQGYHTTDQFVAAVTAAAAAAPSLHESALHAGLHLVQLCVLLLNDATAGAAVAAQLTANAAAFAADAVALLVQSQLGAGVEVQQHLNAAGSAQAVGGQFGEVGLLLQQLKGAQQHIQMLLLHAQPGV